MPIRVNLLAEARMEEDLRRRDPVKRAIYASAFLISMSLVWTSSLFLNVMLEKNQMTRVNNAIMMKTNIYAKVVFTRKSIAEAKQKVKGLEQLTAVRFLQGNLLNALQQTTVDGVQLLRIAVDEKYFITLPVPPKTNNNKVIPGRPGLAREKILVLLEARDSSQNPGEQRQKFKDALANHSYFKEMLDKTNGVELSNLSPPQTGPDGRMFQLFTLRCNFQEHAR